MVAFDLTALLAPLSQDNPTGPPADEGELYDLYRRMGDAATAEASGMLGDEGGSRGPAWKEVGQHASELAARTKDLRVGIHWLAARVAVEGIATIGDSLTLIRRYLEEFWPTVHPQLDPEDNDAIFRVNSLLLLQHPPLVLDVIRRATLVDRPGIGKLCYYDLMAARGERRADADAQAYEESVLLAAFRDCPEESRSALCEALSTAKRELGTIEQIFDRELGASQSPDFSSLVDLLHSIEVLFPEPEAPAQEEVLDGEVAATGAAPAPAARSGPITSADGVLRALGQIIDYYDKYEPSSPIPILVKRARQLVSKDFLSIIENLTPQAVDQINMLRGPQDEEGG